MAEPTTITLEEARELTHGTIIYCLDYDNADGSPQRWRINGKVKTWKTRPDHVQIPIKHGLYSYGYLAYHDLDRFCLIETDAIALRELAR